MLDNLSRQDLHSILTCQASNNNISNPVSTSVKIDMHCEALYTYKWRNDPDVYLNDEQPLSISLSPDSLFDNHLSVILFSLFSRATQRGSAQQKGLHVGWQEI